MFDKLLQSFLSCDRHDIGHGRILGEYEMIHICQAAKPLLLKDPTLIELTGPVTVFGDIHGQYSDLLRWLDRVQMPPEQNFLFLGDYVDRGDNSIEVLCFLLCLKIKYPDRVFLLRGNHEISDVSYDYGFYDECRETIGKSIWHTFTDVFPCLPLAAVVNGSIFCVHGGLSPELETLDQIRRIKRPLDVRTSSMVRDILWGDPTKRVDVFEDNTDRGFGYFYGETAVKRFLERNGLNMICRGHEAEDKGFKIHFPQSAPVVTVFSAPNYCGDFENTAAVMHIDENSEYKFTFLCPMEQDAETASEPDYSELKKAGVKVELAVC